MKNSYYECLNAVLVERKDERCLLRESSRYINDSFGPAICSILWDSGGDLAEVAGSAGLLLRIISLEDMSRFRDRLGDLS